LRRAITAYHSSKSIQPAGSFYLLGFIAIDAPRLEFLDGNAVHNNLIVVFVANMCNAGIYCRNSFKIEKARNFFSAGF
jgi:hypothetical protein